MDLIAALRRMLDPRMRLTKFVLEDFSPLGASESSEHGQVEYRAELHGGRVVLLGLYQVPARRSLVAELWSPNDLTETSAQVSIDDLAIRHRMWRYDAATDLSELVRAIYVEVVTWLDLIGPMRHPRPSMGPMEGVDMATIDGSVVDEQEKDPGTALDEAPEDRRAYPWPVAGGVDDGRYDTGPDDDNLSNQDPDSDD
jgi:hypothetical protein